ncbi:alpha/beta fold hydrolase [Pedobacter metabolipauper]|uniref:Pimeloyl-ACP methyl ester carboxylesterase n=1 Tax=Pedobacter metabolipauper TaxID=425513 RepID=A0A4R6T113_9SPHI|nr:alpha/beta hydrolase [Pedobacter metabolipauper]TDQ11278.1 pimeloyl-ACP methyl ester carboxylesterase [Pedobacter metabolipauper]
MKIFDHVSGSYLDHQGARIYYEVAGNPDGPVLLVIHGGFGHLRNFNYIIPELFSHYKVIGMDTRGHGKSTCGGNGLSYELIQQDAEKIIALLEVKTLCIMGFNDGGTVAYRLAAKAKLFTVEKIVTISSRWRLKDAEDCEELLRGINSGDYKSKFPGIYDLYQLQNPEPDFESFAEDLIRMWFDAEPSGYPDENVNAIGCPLLMIRGEKDLILTQESGSELVALLKNGKLVSIPSAGHQVFSDQPELFNNVVYDFLRPAPLSNRVVQS